MIDRSSLDTVYVEIDEPSKIAAARRAARGLARSCEFDEATLGRLDLVVTEAATNQIRHAERGGVALSCQREDDESWIEMLALDRGPGIRQLGRALRGGHSERGGLGHGLGAIRRLADEFSIFAPPDRGTAVLARIGSPPGDDAPIRLTGAGHAKLGELAYGDGWGARRLPGDRHLLLVLDGVGHGAGAETATRAALDVLADTRHADVERLLEDVHRALEGTRGAAGLAVCFEPRTERLRWAGVGNLRASLIVDIRRDKGLVSLDGTLGAGTLSTRTFEAPWPRGALLVVQTDGVSGRWQIEDHAGLWHQDPALVAGVLLRDHAWHHDDATVVAARRTRPEATP